MSFDREQVAADYALAIRRLEQLEGGYKHPTPYNFKVRTIEFLLVLSRLRNTFGEHMPGRVLEVGCGIGFNLALWADHVDYVCGVDVDGEQIQLAHQIHQVLEIDQSKAKLVVGQGETLPLLDDETFDLVMTQYSLEHVSDVSQTLAEIKRYLSPHGYVVHAVPGAVFHSTWYMAYRQQNSLWRRFLAHVKSKGWKNWLSNPFEFTPPHEARLGDFVDELASFQLEHWISLIMSSGFLVTDYFKTRDNNWVIVTCLP